uniref:Uncharacterized protein n=1 Tax=Phytophthora ramorum TaxID=164328 RepID=H3GSW3_PHYRM
MQISNPASPVPGAQAISQSTRCRYKTGRCPNARAVKANGTLLLLCEYHRNQQNRTKKRSDMKCRHDRAKKRQVQRAKQHKKQQPGSPRHDQTTLCWSPTTSPLASITVPSIGSPSAGGDQDKCHESTSPTAVDMDLSAANWAPAGLSPFSRPKMSDNSFAPEDIWLLEYFIL